MTLWRGEKIVVITDRSISWQGVVIRTEKKIILDNKNSIFANGTLW
jgi:hypothetical protein